MNTFVKRLNKELSNQLLNIELEEADLTKKAQKSTLCIKNALTQLKAFCVQYTFIDEQEEIYFFKKTKPELFSKLIYYVKIFNIESCRPTGSREIQEAYLKHELEKLTFFFSNHLEFYQYYRMDSTYFDDRYFMRGKENLHLYQDTLMFYVDPDFSTSHDYMVAKIIANDRLEVFLKTELDALSIKTNSPNWGHIGDSVQNIQWTDSKTSLVELIYALHAAGVLNNGHCEIRELSAFFEQIFNVRFTDVYHTYIEIKIRSTPTKFLDSLKSALLRKMEEDF